MIFSRVRICPHALENIGGKIVFFIKKNGIIRAVCMFGWQFEFQCYSGMAVSTLRTGAIKLSWEGWAGDFAVKFWIRIKFATKRSLRHLLELQNDLNPSLQNWNLVSEKSTNQGTDPISKYNMFRKWLCSITLFALFSASLFFHGSLCSFGHALLATPSLIVSFSHVFSICLSSSNYLFYFVLFLSHLFFIRWFYVSFAFLNLFILFFFPCAVHWMSYHVSKGKKVLGESSV